MSRCINLAQVLRRSCDVAFSLGTEASPKWHAHLNDEGFNIVDDGSRNKAVVTVLDGYDLQPREVAIWKQRSRALVMIEDLGRHFSGVDLYVSVSGPPPPDARVLAGPQYALLDARYARSVKPPSGDVHTILITCGLRDSAGVTGLYLNALAQCGLLGKAVTVVLSNTAPHREAVQQQVHNFGARALLDAQDMLELYDNADLVLGAGGVSLFERMARGRASVTVIAAKNQAYAAEKMAELGGTLIAGYVKNIDTNAMAKSIVALLADREVRAEMSAIARQSVDGLGAERAAREIMSLAVDVADRASSAGGN